MKLSQACNAFVLVANSETVGYNIDGDEILFTWMSDDEDYCVRAKDQDIVPDKTCHGMFTFIDDEGDTVQFLALTEATLEELSAP